MKVANFVLWLSCLSILTQSFIILGIPFVYGTRDSLWDDYTETREWHEIGAEDPRYQYPCGPGVHEGKLGEPGCLE